MPTVGNWPRAGFHQICPEQTQPRPTNPAKVNLRHRQAAGRFAAIAPNGGGDNAPSPARTRDATQIGRFRRVLGEAGVEQLLKTTIETALAIKAVKPAEFERVIVDSTVQEKAIAHPTDSRLLVCGQLPASLSRHG